MIEFQLTVVFVILGGKCHVTPCTLLLYRGTGSYSESTSRLNQASGARRPATRSAAEALPLSCLLARFPDSPPSADRSSVTARSLQLEYSPRPCPPPSSVADCCWVHSTSHLQRLSGIGSFEAELRVEIWSAWRDRQRTTSPRSPSPPRLRYPEGWLTSRPCRRTLWRLWGQRGCGLGRSEVGREGLIARVTELYPENCLLFRRRRLGDDRTTAARTLHSTQRKENFRSTSSAM